MYYPYFRGKQFDLIAIREMAELMAKSGFVPVIEPVKDGLGGLQRALKAIEDAGGGAVLVVNPFHGDHADDGVQISELLKSKFSGVSGVTAGILLTAETDVEEAWAIYEEHKEHSPAFIHAGFTDGKALAARLDDSLPETTHLFFEKHCGKPYRRHFQGATRVLIRDGFNRLQRNADYPPLELFSDLHVTFLEEGMSGFGDFLTVGDEFKEGGGPAYAVAIHLTFIDSDSDDVMFIHHFVSTTKDTPTDPAGKFGQALEKLVREVKSEGSNIYNSSAVIEFIELHEKAHFPGLGHVKKLSMKHHVETLANFFAL